MTFLVPPLTHPRVSSRKTVHSHAWREARVEKSPNHLSFIVFSQCLVHMTNDDTQKNETHEGTENYGSHPQQSVPGGWDCTCCKSVNIRWPRLQLDHTYQVNFWIDNFIWPANGGLNIQMTSVWQKRSSQGQPSEPSACAIHLSKCNVKTVH